MGHVRVISVFFNPHPKLFAVLKEKVMVNKAASNHDCLINVCHTRLVAPIDSQEIFIALFQPIICAFEEIRDNVDGTWNAALIVDASSLYHSTLTFELIHMFSVFSPCLEVT